MHDDIKLITDALVDLRTARLAIQSNMSEETLHALTSRFDIMFLGENFNIIYSDELFHALKTKWGYNLSLSVLNSELPSICASLGMVCKRLIALDDIKMTNPPTYAYSIRLFS